MSNNLSVGDAENDARRTLIGIVRGDLDLSVLGEPGAVSKAGHGDSTVDEYEVSGMAVVNVTVQDLAAGFLHHWGLGTSLPEWSATMLRADCFELPYDHSPEADLLIEGLMDVTLGEPVSDEVLNIARRFDERSTLIAAWLRYQAVQGQRSDDDPDWWAMEALQDLYREDPDRAWDLMVGLVKASETEWQIVMIGCSILEDLLTKNPDRYMRLLEIEGRTNPKIVTAAAHVWVHEPLRTTVDAFLRRHHQPRL